MEKGFLRPPIVVVLGHVNHGKTSLLDYIRKTRIAQKEAGGITQKIGASQIRTKSGKKITFIDTPGHAAFSKMRARGAKVADIAILVVAADDGVQPQTIEAVKHIKDAQIPFIVALTKVDLKTADVESALGQLEKEAVLLEKRGGDTPWVEVSSKTGKGIEELLDTISLLSEVSGVKGNPMDKLEAVIIEVTKDQRGSVANAVVRKGKIKVGEIIYSEDCSCKVRNLITEEGVTKEALPGDPVQILGFDILPEIGTKIVSTKDVFDKKEESKKESSKVNKDQTGILIKAGSNGSLEAILANISKEIVVVGSGVGDIYESDVLLAKASGAGKIFAFEVKASSSVQKLAESEGVEIEIFKVIYKLFQAVEDIIEKGKVEILGKAEVIASFPFNDKKIAGCKVLSGKISKTDKMKILRNDKEISKVKAISMKKQKQEISEAKQGEEFGILFEPQLDFSKGDMLVSVAK